MSALPLVVPWLAVRHVAPALAGGDGSVRAAHDAFGEKNGAARISYNLLTAAVILLPLVLTVRAEGALLAAGAALYAAGLALETKAAWDFCRPGPHGFADNGLYRVSRNPMYVSYLLVLLGIATLAASPAMLALARLPGGGTQTRAHRGAMVPRALRRSLRGVHGSHAPLPVSAEAGRAATSPNASLG